jgi:hypothetical protein
MLPPWTYKTYEPDGFEVLDVNGKVICWSCAQHPHGTAASAELLTAVPDMWNLVVQLVEAGDKIPDLSPTMKAFIEEARKIKMKVAP